MDEFESYIERVEEDERFQKAIELFNEKEWYSAHDLFEELWHEALGPARITLQGILQVAVAQLHLERGNKNGATLLYGEGLGRLRSERKHHLGLDLDGFCDLVEERLILLHAEQDPEVLSVPLVLKRA